MTDVTISELKRKRGGYKAIITHFQNKLDRKELVRLADFESALQRVKLMYNKYYEVQSELEGLINNDKDDAILDKFVFEDQYGLVESELLTQISIFEKNANDVSKLNQYKLPNVDLPKFDGLPINWLNFKGIYSKLVHDNVKLSDTTKFSYLISCLRGGKAYHIIEPYPIDEVNYVVAWQSLINHFDDETLIQEIHVKELYEIKRPQENNCVSLQTFIDTVNKHYMALHTMDEYLNVFNLFLLHHLLEKLDIISKVEVLKKKSENHNNSLTFEAFIEILQSRVKILRSIKTSVSGNASYSNTSKHKDGPGYKPRVEKVFMSKYSDMCEYCKGNHKLRNCLEFKKPDVSPMKRFGIVRSLQLCTNCLDSNHKVVECQDQGCSLCSLKHNILLHFKGNGSGGTSQSRNKYWNHASPGKTTPIQSSSSNENIPNVQSSTVAHSSIDDKMNTLLSQVVLPTAIVWATREDGTVMSCRALLDSGSQSHFVTEHICQLTNIKKNPTTVSIVGINQRSSSIKSSVLIKIQSRTSNYEIYLKFLVLPNITNNLPSNYIPVNTKDILQQVPLADPWFYKPNSIDMILGAEIFNEIVSLEKLVLFKEMPPFINTLFGYVIAGKYSPLQAMESPSKLKSYNTNHSSTFVCTLQELSNQIQRFWELESIKSQQNYSIQEKLCEEHFTDNVTRDSTGRYVTSLPFNSKIKNIGDSSNAAMAQFKTLEAKLKRNPKLQVQYCEFINEYITLQHMEEVVDPNVITNPYGKSFYLPHHCVLKEASTTTKLRVVFNASQRSSTGITLNECLLVGPTIQQDLWSIIMRFRKHPVAFCADIAKMYRQVKINDSDSDFQRIYWRESSENEIKCYKLKTITYGTASAPFSAIRTLHQLADDEKVNYPEASIILKRDFYVDDVLTGANSISEASTLKTDLTNLLNKGGFELRKFVSNEPSILSSGNELSQNVSVLGLRWDYRNDNFQMHFDQFEIDKPKVYTKRMVLSEISKLFDPLGICAPMIFIAKLFMQTLWSHTELNWDTELPSNLKEYWVQFKSQLVQLKRISFPRTIGIQKYKRVELHGFGDASEKGYGCVIYIRIIDLDDNITLRLLNAKSRVAPLKSQTIPRLELCASLLLAELMEKTLGIMEINFQSVYYWSDSEITLLRIKSEPSKFVVFVANRLSQIQELSSPNDWHFVPTEMNPADLVSRGLMPEQFEKSSLWWDGPQFLYLNHELWPKPSATKINENVEFELRKNQTVLVSHIANWSVFEKYSSINRLLRITALCKRFIDNCKSKRENRKVGRITTHELESATKHLIRTIQQSEFGDEIKTLRKSQIVSPKSNLKSLSPFLDNEELLRVGGRLHHANIPYDSQHQYILPASHAFAKLVTRCEHERMLHCGPQSLLYSLRLKYWIIGGRNLCRKTVNNCIKCFRVRPKINSQIMGDLPNPRVNPSRPFAITGVDFCGPFNICHQLRKKIMTKVYVALFICFSTKAIHMEIVDNLSTQAFIATLRRFVGRRGLCSHIYSDNATNFVGSQAELIKLQKLFSEESHQRQIDKFCSSTNMQWHTIPARSPHFGGLWEAGVKSAKHHLKCTIGQTSFLYENLHTVIVQIEACLNSRPLSPMSHDPNDMTCLTPGHFLIGQPLTALPDPSLEHLTYNKLSQYQRVQYLLQQFWKRWSKEYLLQLQHRRKWLEPSDQFKVGTLVLLHDENLPPMKWSIGRIVKTFLGDDKKVRVVLIKTGNGEFKRAITKVSVLPIDPIASNSL